MMVNQSANLDFLRNLLKLGVLFVRINSLGTGIQKVRIEKGAIKSGAKLP